MKIIILSTLGALILLGVGVYIVFQLSERDKIEGKSFFRLENRWLYGFLAYTSVIVITFLVLILQTSLTRQEQTLENTQARFQQELTAFRERLGDQTDRLMSQINEKAELTGSEVEVRGKLSNEIAHHQRTRKELAATREQLRLTQSDLNRETRAHRAYLDSLNTERSLRASTQNRLEREEARHAKSREILRNTRQKLDRANERLNVQNRQIKTLRSDLKNAQDNADNARQIANRLLQKSGDHQRALMTLQATVDSLFLKEFKRPRVSSDK